MEALAKTFKQLGHPDRLRILAALQGGELSVSELVSVLDLSQPRITQYLASLEAAGVVERLREGSWVFARLVRRGPLQAVVGAALNAVPADDAQLHDDRQRLSDVREARAEDVRAFFADVANNAGQLSHDFLPSAPIERALLAAAGEGPFSHMVDFGTGSGRMLQLFAARVRRGTGLDLSAEMLRVARHQLAGEGTSHLTVRRGDITRTELDNASADLVTLHHVLHYLDDPASVLAEAARVLAPGGTLLVADFAAHEHEAFRDAYAHRRLGFSPAEMEALITAQGLSSETVTAHDVAPDAPTVLVWQARQPWDAQHRSAA